MSFKKVLAALKRNGWLLESDATRPSVTAIVVGKPIRGSWWGHAKGRAIWRVLVALSDHPDVTVARLVDGKVTFVHRKLWPALVAVGKSAPREKLSAAARALLRKVEAKGAVRASGDAARELEKRLLVASREIHTETGAHAKALETWNRWARRVRCTKRLTSRRAAAMLGLSFQEGSWRWKKP